jgi:putative salt-induced outer membrane protein YdiY
MKPNPHQNPSYRYALAAALGLLPATWSVTAADAAAPPEKKEPRWESSAGLAFAVATGNTENMLFTANASTQRLGERNEWRFGASAGYGESRPPDDGDPATDESMEQNTGFVRGFGQYNRLFTDRFYGLARLEAQHDSIADIDYRVPLSVGAGYYFLKDEKFTLSADLGPGYVWEKLAGQTEEYAALRAGEKFEWKISATARLWQTLEYTPQIDDFENSVIEATLGVESKLYGNLSLRVEAQDIYRTRPALIAGTNQSRENNDFRLLAGLNYSF